jgi:hypothetical protein
MWYVLIWPYVNLSLSAYMYNLHIIYSRNFIHDWLWPKGVGRGPTLAWPGWKQPDISVKVDTARLEAGQFKNCCMECVLLYYPSTEFKSAFNVYWHSEGAAGLSCTELSIWEFPFLRGVCWQGCTSIWYCEKGMPQKDTLDNLRTPVCFRIPSTSFTSVSIFSVWCYSSVSISMLWPHCTHSTVQYIQFR